jgi:CheY-like chemotaxis protein
MEEGKSRILVVEDDEINLCVVTEILKTVETFEMDTAHDGREAVAKYQSGQFDLILMDIQLPVMDGLTATRKIRDIQQEQGRRVPIIALTAYALSGDREKFLADGMDDYLSKPLKVDTLLGKVKEWLPKGGQ